MKPFLFKQFAIHQDKTAMKVGTDGVLLGAWVEVKQVKKILDIGTGTGLIALMLAQRCENAKIDALEIDNSAFKQAKYNCSISKWKEYLKVFFGSFQDYTTDTKYDLIVSNPPFFDSIKTISSNREQARQMASLSFEYLIERSATLLSATGELALILPYDTKEKICALAAQSKLYAYRIYTVKGSITSKPKRILIQFSKVQKPCITTELIIEISRHNYTSDYISLVKDFYLKM